MIVRMIQIGVKNPDFEDLIKLPFKVTSNAACVHIPSHANYVDSHGQANSKH